MHVQNDILGEYTGDFETVGNTLIQEIEQKTNIR